MTLAPKEVLPGTDPWTPGPSSPPPRPAQQAATPVAWTLIGVAVATFLAQSLKEGVVEAGALYGPAVGAGEVWRIVTFVFLHGSLLHLVFNLSVVWTLGRNLEPAIGSARFALASALGVLGSAVFVLWFNFDQVTVGLSGVVLTWAGLALPILDRRARGGLWLWLGQVVVISLLPGVSWAGHLGGFLAGLAAGAGLRRGPRAFSFATAATAVLLTALLWATVARHQG